jgi:phenylalanyl-tRNA synthetase beta chain
MRIPVDWLNEYVPNNLSVRDLAYTLTDVGLEVEAIEDMPGGAVLDITVMSNRGDCLSALGVARELAMALRVDVRDREPQISESGPPASTMASIVLEDPVLCPRYSARIVRNVQIGPSPAWAQQRLERCGLRPINNVVDATNLAMLELGQPLHAFDYQLLRCPAGESIPEIIVRRARAGERIVTIDGEEYDLTSQILLITDPTGPIALAGIMGGSSTEIHNGTTQVLLESAHFDPGTVRRGARSLGMSTEASYRFERTVDPGGTVRALDRACELIAEFCEKPVEVAAGVVDAYPNPVREAEITLRPARANALLGLDLSASEMAAHLRQLRLTVEEGEALRVRVPTFRQELKEEIDLIEELARAHGYAEIPETLPRASSGVGSLSREMAFERQVRDLMRGFGLSEAVTSSLESPESLARLQLPEGHPLLRALVLSNAKTVDHSQLRTTLLTSLLDVLASNRRRGVEDVSVFDLGRVYRPDRPDELPAESQHLGVAGAGVVAKGRWAAVQGQESWDFYALKGVVENVLLATARSPGEYAPESHPCLVHGRAARVALGGNAIGYLGELRPGICAAYEVLGPVFVAELDLDLLRAHAGAEPRYEPVSRFPAVTRDVAFLVRRDTPARQAETLIRQRAGNDLESLALFDAYEGRPLPEGYRNLAFSLTFRRLDRTLTDEEVNAAMERIRGSLRDELGAQLRE